MNNTIIFKLFDNSSELDFNPDYSVASLIYSSLLEDKYLNGGMDLGVFDFRKNSTIISSLSNVLSDENSFNSYLSSYIMSLVDNVTFMDLFNYLTDTKLLASVAGGLLFEAGMIALPTGLPGLALLGVGTVLTAYGSGMLDDLGTDLPGYAKPENQLNFGISMGLNFAGLGFSEGFARGVLYKEVQEKLITGFVPSIKAYGKTIADETLGKEYGKIGGICKSYINTVIENFLIEKIENRCL